MRNTKILFSILLFTLLLVASCTREQTTATNTQDQTPPLPPGTTTGGDVTTGETKEFTMTAKRFEFSPSVITVNQGDKVRLKITSIDVPHGFFLPDFGINEQLNPGKEVVVEFVAKTKGTYSFRCSVPCGSGHQSMSGTLIVE